MPERANDATEPVSDNKRLPLIERVPITVRIVKLIYNKLEETSVRDKISKNRIFENALREYLSQEQCYFCGEKIPRKSKFCPYCGEMVIRKDRINAAIELVGMQKAMELGLPSGEDQYKCIHSYEPRIEISNQTRRYLLDHIITHPDNHKYIEQREHPIEITIDEIKNQLANMPDTE